MSLIFIPDRADIEMVFFLNEPVIHVLAFILYLELKDKAVQLCFFISVNKQMFCMF